MIDLLKLAAATTCFTLALAVSAFTMASDPVSSVTNSPETQSAELSDESFEYLLAQQCDDCNDGFIYGVDVNMSQMEVISRTA